MARKIAIFTDAHGLLEPTKAAIEDMHRRGITEIYSLGDNIGVGPNPAEVIDLLEENGVISIAGNSEEYVTLGIWPFQSYFHSLKEQSQLWTLSKLNEHQKGIISLYPHSIELILGGKKLALCHFANDVRIDFGERSTWSYQGNVSCGYTGYYQFFYTNSAKQWEEIKRRVENGWLQDPSMGGYLSAQKDPLFGGKRVNFFDAVIQGHVHWKLYEKMPKDERVLSIQQDKELGNPTFTGKVEYGTDFYSIRAVGMAYGKDPIDTASYVILTEKEDGYDFEEVLVRYDRERMEYSILNSGSPDTNIYKFTNMKRR